MEIKCIVTDDEPLARKGLKGYIEKIGFLSLVGECEDALQLSAELKNQPVDLIFLDIEMPEMTGLELLNTMKNSPKVIIVSAYEQYALKGYEFNVVDYLLKPVSFERFFKSVNKVYEIFQREQKLDNREYLFVKSGKQLKKIQIIDLLFIESMENYVIIYTSNSKEIVSTTLKKMLERLPEDVFLQVHRCYIVNINHINAMDGNILKVDSHQIPVARSFRDTLINRIV
ncbi:LytR/AlgR family response regulator transcription factor [Pedobacter cryoconitis]|uniref:LytTR family two component transcriptional regulator n=1 Tax=Pedobacter cryoconitis TaxID=188932 RepID=A0A327SZG0_9SPHI|nr:LytTR family DNA-binding domain-containing protein [Pedobacter cryoconitis]RAJ32873.1 LytTR family two component transcriptional regulator [Pedobacter cryoconitis]